MGLLNQISRRFGPTVELHIALTEFAFRCGRAEARLAPVARVSAEGKFHAVGEEARTVQEGRLDDYFAEPHRRGREWPHEESLALFCRYGLLLARADDGQAGFLRPNVVLVGAGSLREVLDREEDEILLRVLGRAGAASVTRRS